jgi:ADP-ribosyl-[dinitrogen reductase] hydrolase
MNAQERFRGCLVGLAVGDALGTSIEFSPPGTFVPLTDMLGGGPFHLLPGQWTDDTSMALCLAESLVECQGFDPVDQLKRYNLWSQEGHLSSNGRCFDIGGTVRQALRRFQQTGEPFCGSTDPSTAGNGSLMRLAPVPMFFADRPVQAIERSAQCSRTTHAAPAAVDACRYMGALICGALTGEAKEVLLSRRYAPVSGCWEKNPLVREIDEIACGSFKNRQPPEIKGTGYVVKSLEAALWAFYRSESYQEGCLMAANLGDDADTTAAIYGQLAGANYGLADIPIAWREKLALYALIEAFADRLMPGAWHVNDYAS